MNPKPAVAVLAAQAEPTNATDSDIDIDLVCGGQGGLCETLYEWTDNELLAEATSLLLGTPLKIIVIVATALIVNRLLQRGIRRFTDRIGTVTAEHGEAVVDERSVARAEQRAGTAGSLLRSLSTALIYGAALILILESFGISMLTIIAGAGVLSLAIGFGAQSLVEDLLRGVFMLLEDQFGVGDRIDVGAVNGVVERVTLRTIVIRDPQGTLWHVPNSEIDRVANEAQLISRATIEVGVSYAADLGEAMAVLLAAADRAAAEAEWADVIAEPPQVAGVQNLGDDAVEIRVNVWVDSGERRRFERHLRRRLKEALDAAGIELPNRQVDVWMRSKTVAA